MIVIGKHNTKKNVQKWNIIITVSKLRIYMCVSKVLLARTNRTIQSSISDTIVGRFQGQMRMLRCARVESKGFAVFLQLSESGHVKPPVFRNMQIFQRKHP